MNVLVLFSFVLLSVTAVTNDHERYERAIGGRQFERGRWPWLVLMKATIETGRRFFFFSNHYHMYCGGVLVSRRWVLTAAHCFERGTVALDPGNWKARLGTVRLRPTVRQRFEDLWGRITRQDSRRDWQMNIDTIVLHPDYILSSDPSEISNHDLALVKLSRDVPVSDRIRPVRLPSANLGGFPQVGQPCFTKGWGCTRRGGRASHRAREIMLPIFSPRNCRRTFNVPITSNMLCAGYIGGRTGVCSGDSGSPLVCMSGGEYTLAGIVSFTSKYNPESFPAVLTRVQSYLPWIQSVIAD